MNTLTVAPWTESMNTMPLSDLAALSGVSLPALSQYCLLYTSDAADE